MNDPIETLLRTNKILQSKVDLVAQELLRMKQEIINREDPTPLEVYMFVGQLLKELDGWYNVQ